MDSHSFCTRSTRRSPGVDPQMDLVVTSSSLVLVSGQTRIRAARSMELSTNQLPSTGTRSDARCLKPRMVTTISVTSTSRLQQMEQRGQRSQVASSTMPSRSFMTSIPRTDLLKVLESSTSTDQDSELTSITRNLAVRWATRLVKQSTSVILKSDAWSRTLRPFLKASVFQLKQL